VKDLRIIFIGDSFVNGVGDLDLLGWAGRVCQQLIGPDAAVTYYNLGVRRDTSADIAARWEREIDARRALAPKIVFSWGVNDTAVEGDGRRVSDEDSCRNFVDIVGRASERWPVFFVGPPVVLDPNHNARLAALTEELKARAHAMGIGFLTPFTTLLDDPVWQAGLRNGDGSHPDGRGYGRLASIIGADPTWRAWISE
jgi:lysophospholipase L1-like esterase